MLAINNRFIYYNIQFKKVKYFIYRLKSANVSLIPNKFRSILKIQSLK